MSMMFLHLVKHKSQTGMCCNKYDKSQVKTRKISNDLATTSGDNMLQRPDASAFKRHLGNVFSVKCVAQCLQHKRNVADLAPNEKRCLNTKLNRCWMLST